MSMNFSIWRGMVEFAKDIQYLVSRGWSFTIEYGEEKYNLNDRMVFTKNLETVKVWDAEGLSNLIRVVDECSTEYRV